MRSPDRWPPWRRVGTRPLRRCAQKRELVVATSQTDAGKLDPHQASAGADKGMLNWMFNGLVRISPGQASPEFIEPDLAEKLDVQRRQAPNGRSRSAPACSATATTASSPPRTRRTRCKRAADQGDLGIRRRFRRASTRSRPSTSDGQDHAEEPRAEPARPPLQLSRRPDGLPKGGRGDGRRLRQEADRHRAVRVRRVPAAAVREAAPPHTGYFRGAPQLEAITYRYIPSDATPRPRFPVRRGRHDVRPPDQPVGGAHARHAGRQGRRHGAGRAERASISTPRSKPLDDIRVRQAIAHAIDRKAHGRSSRAPDVVARGDLGRARTAISAPTSGPSAPTIRRRRRRCSTEAGYPERHHAQGRPRRRCRACCRMIGGAAGAASRRPASTSTSSRWSTRPTTPRSARTSRRSMLYQAARFPVADVYLTQFFHSRSHRRHADGGHQLHPLRRGRRGDRRRAQVEPDPGQAEGAVEARAGEDRQGGLRASRSPSSCSHVGLEGQPRSRLRAEGLAQPDAARSPRRRASRSSGAGRSTAAESCRRAHRVCMTAFLHPALLSPCVTLLAVLTLVFLHRAHRAGRPGAGDPRRPGQREAIAGLAPAARASTSRLGAIRRPSWRGALGGDWGVSMVTAGRSSSEVLKVLPWTIELTSCRSCSALSASRSASGRPSIATAPVDYVTRIALAARAVVSAFVVGDHPAAGVRDPLPGSR